MEFTSYNFHSHSYVIKIQDVTDNDTFSIISSPSFFHHHHLRPALVVHFSPRTSLCVIAHLHLFVYLNYAFDRNTLSLISASLRFYLRIFHFPSFFLIPNQLSFFINSHPKPHSDYPNSNITSTILFKTLQKHY